MRHVRPETAVGINRVGSLLTVLVAGELVVNDTMARATVKVRHREESVPANDVASHPSDPLGLCRSNRTALSPRVPMKDAAVGNRSSLHLPGLVLSALVQSDRHRRNPIALVLGGCQCACAGVTVLPDERRMSRGCPDSC